MEIPENKISSSISASLEHHRTKEVKIKRLVKVCPQNITKVHGLQKKMTMNSKLQSLQTPSDQKYVILKINKSSGEVMSVTSPQKSHAKPGSGKNDNSVKIVIPKDCVSSPYILNSASKGPLAVTQPLRTPESTNPKPSVVSIIHEASYSEVVPKSMTPFLSHASMDCAPAVVTMPVAPDMPVNVLSLDVAQHDTAQIMTTLPSPGLLESKCFTESSHDTCTFNQHEDSPPKIPDLDDINELPCAIDSSVNDNISSDIEICENITGKDRTLGNLPIIKHISSELKTNLMTTPGIIVDDPKSESTEISDACYDPGSSNGLPLDAQSLYNDSTSPPHCIIKPSTSWDTDGDASTADSNLELHSATPEPHLVCPDECYVFVESKSGRLVYINKQGHAFMDAPGRGILLQASLEASANDEQTVNETELNQAEQSIASSSMEQAPLFSTSPFHQEEVLDTEIPDEIGAETVVGEDIELVESNPRHDSSTIPESVLKGGRGLPRFIYRSKQCAMGFAAAFASNGLLTMNPEINKKEKDKSFKRWQRSDPAFRERERTLCKERMKAKRADPEYRAKEREKDKMRRRAVRSTNKTLYTRERERDKIYQRKKRDWSRVYELHSEMCIQPNENGGST